MNTQEATANRKRMFGNQIQANKGPVEETSFGENFDAGMTTFIDEDTSISEYINSGAYRERDRQIDGLIASGQVDPKNYTEDGSWDYSRMSYDLKRHGMDIKDDYDVRTGIRETLNIQRDVANDIHSRASLAGDAGMFIGQMVGAQADPINIGAMLIPGLAVIRMGTFAARAGKAAAYYGASGVASETIIQTSYVQDWKDKIGLEYTAGDSLEAIAWTGVGSAVFGTAVEGAVSGAQIGYRRIKQGFKNTRESVRKSGRSQEEIQHDITDIDTAEREYDFQVEQYYLEQERLRTEQALDEDEAFVTMEEERAYWAWALEEQQKVLDGGKISDLENPSRRKFLARGAQGAAGVIVNPPTKLLNLVAGDTNQKVFPSIRSLISKGTTEAWQTGGADVNITTIESLDTTGLSASDAKLMTDLVAKLDENFISNDLGYTYNRLLDANLSRSGIENIIDAEDTLTAFNRAYKTIATGLDNLSDRLDNLDGLDIEDYGKYLDLLNNRKMPLSENEINLLLELSDDKLLEGVNLLNDTRARIAAEIADRAKPEPKPREKLSLKGPRGPRKPGLKPEQQPGATFEDVVSPDNTNAKFDEEQNAIIQQMEEVDRLEEEMMLENEVYDEYAADDNVPTKAEGTEETGDPFMDFDADEFQKMNPEQRDAYLAKALGEDVDNLGELEVMTDGVLDGDGNVMYETKTRNEIEEEINAEIENIDEFNKCWRG